MRLAEPLRAERILSVQGTVDVATNTQLHAPVLVEIHGQTDAGKSIIFNSGATNLLKADADSGTYRFDLRVPEMPGNYNVDVRLAEDWIGRAAIEVKGR